MEASRGRAGKQSRRGGDGGWGLPQDRTVGGWALRLGQSVSGRRVLPPPQRAAPSLQLGPPQLPAPTAAVIPGRAGRAPCLDRWTDRPKAALLSCAGIHGGSCRGSGTFLRLGLGLTAPGAPQVSTVSAARPRGDGRCVRTRTRTRSAASSAGPAPAAGETQQGLVTGRGLVTGQGRGLLRGRAWECPASARRRRTACSWPPSSQRPGLRPEALVPHSAKDWGRAVRAENPRRQEPVLAPCTGS